jgi:serine O-acetyltransferase
MADAPVATPATIVDRATLRDFRAADLAVQGFSRWRPSLRYRKPALHYLRVLRLVEYRNRPDAPRWQRPLQMVDRYRLNRLAVLTGISIPPGTFGRGLCLPHYGDIVVHSRARFGDWCCLQSGINVGAGESGVPRGGDFVYIAPGAVLYGGIQIGSRATIGANAVVGRDVPPGTTWAGAPARKISDHDSSRVMNAVIAAKMAQF